MKKLLSYLEGFPFPVYLSGTSALDVYYRLTSPHFLYLETEGTLINLAKSFTDLSYPGKSDVDAEITRCGSRLLFRCVEVPGQSPAAEFPEISLVYDVQGKKFIDKRDIYPRLRKKQLDPPLTVGSPGRYAAEAALLVGRYDFRGAEKLIEGFPALGREAFENEPLPDRLTMDQQRDLLIQLLTGKNPPAGLTLLMKSGFVETYWPELAALDRIAHSKEYHPEGNVWQHSLETFGYRKTNDLVIALGLLLHDTGKPLAAGRDGRAFDKHAQIGAAEARRFMKRLQFEEEIIRQVSFLVSQHMLPEAIPRIPAYRVEDVLISPLFPKVLELYRCDLLSTFRGPEGYYRACKAYRRFLRNKNNPFRTVDGKKLVFQYVE
jgi:poly(A) polymerase